MRRFTIALVACLMIGLLESGEYAFWLRLTGKPFSLARVLVRECPPWILWAVCVPATISWSERHRLEWPPGARVIFAHLGGIAVATLVFAVTRVIIERALQVGDADQSILQHVRTSIVFSGPLAVITYGATVGLGYAASYGARSRQLLELQSELSKAQLTALRMQLNPHFFFNTLHTIGALVRDGNHVGAVEMIEKLGDVLHHVLRSDGAPETPLREEVEFLRKYLEIEQVRFGDRLRVAWELDEASESVPVPQLILQPLVENALRHGLSRRARPGSLEIRAQVQSSSLELVVADDGVGLPADFSAGRSVGVGLANVRARLSRMYGEAARLSLAPGENGGVTARIVLPLAGSGGTTEARGE